MRHQRADERGDGYGAFRLGMLRSRAGDWDAATDAWERAEERGYEEPPFRSASPKTPTAPVAVAAPHELQRAAFANPVLIGAVTVLVAIVAVFFDDV